MSTNLIWQQIQTHKPNFSTLLYLFQWELKKSLNLNWIGHTSQEVELEFECQQRCCWMWTNFYRWNFKLFQLKITLEFLNAFLNGKDVYIVAMQLLWYSKWLLVQPHICLIQVCVILWILTMAQVYTSNVYFYWPPGRNWTLNCSGIAIFPIVWGAIPIAEMGHNAAKNEQQW